jgi:DNA-binding HxlR family transcriptional regulator
MTQRRYRSPCPIARALDRVGDRWTLLIVRDLQAGPARFSELAQGLPGIASNLLCSRLEQLQADGLVLKREAEFNVTVYELTELGAATDRLLYLLADYGARFAPADDVRQPGTMRLLGNTLRLACQLVAEPTLSLRAMLLVDGERLGLTVDQGVVSLRHGAAEERCEVVVTIGYEPLAQALDGSQPTAALPDQIEQLSGEPEARSKLMTLLGAALGARAAQLATYSDG